jgi:hypothetical protein
MRGEADCWETNPLATPSDKSRRLTENFILILVYCFNLAESTVELCHLGILVTKQDFELFCDFDDDLPAYALSQCMLMDNNQQSIWF